MTLVEVLIAMGIGTILLLFVTSISTRVAQVKNHATTRLFDELDSGLGIRVLVNQLNRSQVLRTRLFDCGGIGANFAKDSGAAASFTLEEGGSFAFPYWESNGIASLDANSMDEVIVSDFDRFPVGSMVMLFKANDAKTGGLFQVLAVDAAKGSLKLGPGNLGKNTSECQISGANNKSLAQLRGSGNSAATVYMMQRVRVASYSIEKGVLNLQTYPSLAAEAPKLSVVQGVQQVSLKFDWLPYGTSSAAGRMKIDTRITYQTVTATERAGGQAANAQTRTIASQGSYEIVPVQRENATAETSAAPQTAKFPTCSVFLTSDDSAKIPSGFTPVPNGKLFRLSGAFSDVKPTAIDVGVTADPGSAFPVILCVSPSGSVGSSAMSLSVSGETVQSWLCSIRGKFYLSGSMKYYDESLGKQMSVACTGTSTSVASGWKYAAGSQTTCTPAGGISLGSLVDNAEGTTPGPTLDVGGCRWSDDPSSLKSCDLPADPAVTLLEIKLIPNGLSIDGASLNVTCN